MIPNCLWVTPNLPQCVSGAYKWPEDDPFPDVVLPPICRSELPHTGPQRRFKHISGRSGGNCKRMGRRAINCRVWLPYPLVPYGEGRSWWGEGQKEELQKMTSVFSFPEATTCLLFLHPLSPISFSPPEKSVFLINTIIDSKGKTEETTYTLRKAILHNEAQLLSMVSVDFLAFPAPPVPLFSFLLCSSPEPFQPTLN